jgi:predicted phosphodiesterase
MTKIILFGDNDTTADAVKVLDAIKKETNVDQYVFLGDGPYAKEGTKWVGMMKPYFPDTTKLMLSQGNHEHEESESAKTESDIEAWIPSLKDTPEKGTDQSWENTKWISSKQVGDIFVMCMNSQDLDVEFKRNQYNWVTKQLGKAIGLQKSGKVNWIINAVHKPWFTLKSSHSPYTAVREIYSDIFKNVVDMNFHGHNHNDQAWFPMVAIKESGNAAGKPLFTLAADKKTLDFTKERGFITNICGHSGHEHNLFKEAWNKNTNVMWANDKTYSYIVMETNLSTKIATVTWKDIAGKVLFQYNVTKAGNSMATPPPTTTPPPKEEDPDIDNDPIPPTVGTKPATPPPGPGYYWHVQLGKWNPKLEDPAFLQQQNKPAAAAATGTTTPPPPQTTTPTTPTAAGEKVLWDSNVHLKTGKKYTITETYGGQEPDGKGIFMAASGDPRVHVEPDGTFFLEADAGHGRMYIQCLNYNARMEGEVMFPDEAIRNTTWRLRSRHNEGGDCQHRFGGFGATHEREEQLAEFATEPCHNLHSNTKKVPLEKKIEIGKWIKFKYSVWSSEDKKSINQKTEYDYGDGQGFKTILEANFTEVEPYMMDEASFKERSYAWLRINNESTGKVAYRNVRIIGLP